MQRNLVIASLAAACVAATPAVLSVPAEAQTIIVVKGPTVVAFCEPLSDKVLMKDAGSNETLSDFQLYARQVRGPLQHKGVEFQEMYASSFRLQDGDRVALFRPGKVKVGYYFVAPGMKPQIRYGVMTDADILQAANEYFGFKPAS